MSRDPVARLELLPPAAPEPPEPACHGGGPHRWEIERTRWRCQVCGYARPPRPVRQRGAWTTTGRPPRRPRELDPI